MWTGFAAMNPDDAGNPPSFRFSKTHNEELWTGALPWRPQGKEMKAACVGSSGKNSFFDRILANTWGRLEKYTLMTFSQFPKFVRRTFLNVNSFQSWRGWSGARWKNPTPHRTARFSWEWFEDIWGIFVLELIHWFYIY